MARNQERRQAMRERLIECAVDVLVERGADGFTTPLVAARCGVAQGSVFRYFPTKLELVVAATEAAIASTMADHAAVLQARMEEEAPSDAADLARLVIEVLWGAYTDERILAVYEVRGRCRTDPELAAALLPVLASTDVGGADILSFLVPAAFLVPGGDLRALSRLVTNALQGRGFTRASLPDPEADELLIGALTEILARHLRADAEAGAPRP